MSLPEERSSMVGIGLNSLLWFLVWLSYSDKTRGNASGLQALCVMARKGGYRARAVIKEEHQLATIIPLE